MIESRLRFQYNESRNKVTEVLKDSKHQMIKQEFSVKYTRKEYLESYEQEVVTMMMTIFDDE